MAEYIPYQDIARDNIREVFPDAPERCLDCPALRQAAGSLLSGDAYLVYISTSPDNPGNPVGDPNAVNTENGIITGFLVDTLSGINEEQQRSVHDAAQYLWESCSDEGTLVTNEEKRGALRNRVRVRTVVCGSAAAFAKFVSPGQLRPPVNSREFIE